MARRTRARPAPRPARLPRARGRRWLRRARGVGLVAVALSGVWGLRQADVFYPVEQPYSRGLYDHWVDADGDCQDTRHEVLIRDSTARVRLTADGCRVVGGRWIDPYSGRVITDPSALDVDHLVPLAEAHRSGADRWSADRRRAFANDLSSPLTLLPVGASANRSKADGDPLAWMPGDPTRWCAYTRAWMAVKTRWGLDRDLLERWWTDGVLWVCRAVG
ncbi:HNH endonuclease family protein [uncultured Rhodospira sp.]|uniref:HNH endonuclease family protein n=1 Tax=uncultured Rhodospira sp. TaxID=1936189 RepID=UPI00263145A5|nr:HNH endonuclease family protein [uncultured Rhodospira sp.]